MSELRIDSADLKTAHADQADSHHYPGHDGHFDWASAFKEVSDLVICVCPPILEVEVVGVVHERFQR